MDVTIHETKYFKNFLDDRLNFKDSDTPFVRTACRLVQISRSIHGASLLKKNLNKRSFTHAVHHKGQTRPDLFEHMTDFLENFTALSHP